MLGGAGTSAAATAAPGSPSSSSGWSSSSNYDPSEEQHPDVTDLVREADQACSRYSAATGEIGRLRGSLDAVEVALGAAEEETVAARDVTADALARVIGEFHGYVLLVVVLVFVVGRCALIVTIGRLGGGARCHALRGR